MDQYNNAKGRDFGKNGGSCAEQCLGAAQSNELVTYTRGSTPGYRN